MRADVGRKRKWDMGMAKPKESNEFAPIYEWVDAVPLSRKRKNNFARDFSDGCLTAEVIKHYAGGKFAVDMHNYSEALSGPRKRDNWNLLNEKVLRRHLGIKLSKAQIEELCSATDGAAQRLLLEVKVKLDAGAAPPVRKPLPAPPAASEVAKDGRGKGQGAQAARPLAGNPSRLGRGGHGQRDRSPAPAVEGAHGRQAGANIHYSRPAERRSPHPPAGHDGDGKAVKAWEASPAPQGAGRGRNGQRASSASKAAQRVSPKRAAPGPAGRGRESREWWGESSQDRGRFAEYGDAVRGEGRHPSLGEGSGDRWGGGGLDHLIDLAQGDLRQFDMQLQMHIRNDAREREDVLLPPIKNAHKKGGAGAKNRGEREQSLSPAKRQQSLSPAKMRKSKESPLKLLPEREHKAKGHGGMGGGRDVSPSRKPNQQGGVGKALARGRDKEMVGNKARRDERREAWAELEREGGVPAEEGTDLVEECDEALDGLRQAHSVLEKAIQKLEERARQVAIDDQVPDVRELGMMVSAANDRMARKARKQGANAGGAGGGGWYGDGAWGAYDVDLYKDLGPHYSAAEDELPKQHLRRVPEMELMGLQAVGGGGPGGVKGMGAGPGWGEYRRMHGEIQNYPWFNPYLPSVAADVNDRTISSIDGAADAH